LGRSGDLSNLLLSEKIGNQRATFYKINRGDLLRITDLRTNYQVIHYRLRNFFADIHLHARFLEEYYSYLKNGGLR
jgi:lipoyl(octanoyl) transferase